MSISVCDEQHDVALLHLVQELRYRGISLVRHTRWGRRSGDLRSDQVSLQPDFTSRPVPVPTWLSAGRTQGSPSRPWSAGRPPPPAPVRESSKSVRRLTTVRPATPGVSGSLTSQAGPWPHTTIVLSIVSNTRKIIPHSVWELFVPPRHLNVRYISCWASCWGSSSFFWGKDFT